MYKKEKKTQSFFKRVTDPLISFSDSSGVMSCASSLSSDEDTKAKLCEADNLRRVAFFSVTVSTIAILISVITVPMLYNYMQVGYLIFLLEVLIEFMRSTCILLCKMKLIFVNYVPVIFGEKLPELKYVDRFLNNFFKIVLCHIKR